MKELLVKLAWVSDLPGVLSAGKLLLLGRKKSYAQLCSASFHPWYEHWGMLGLASQITASASSFARM